MVFFAPDGRLAAVSKQYKIPDRKQSKQISVNLSKERYEFVRQLSEQGRVSMSRLLSGWLEEHIRELAGQARRESAAEPYRKRIRQLLDDLGDSLPHSSHTSVGQLADMGELKLAVEFLLDHIYEIAAAGSPVALTAKNHVELAGLMSDLGVSYRYGRALRHVPPTPEVEVRMMWSVQALAAPADVQRMLFPDFVCVPDELALEFDEAFREYASGAEPPPVCLTQLDNKLAMMSGQENKELWEEPALAHAREWDEVRVLAKHALDDLRWPATSPPLDRNFYVGPPS